MTITTYLPDDVSECLTYIGISLEKAQCLLSDLTNDYTFTERPMADMNTCNHEAATLIWEYNRIDQHIQMTQDYVHSICLLTDHAMKLDSEIRKGGVIND